MAVGMCAVCVAHDDSEDVSYGVNTVRRGRKKVQFGDPLAVAFLSFLLPSRFSSQAPNIESPLFFFY